MLNSTPHPGVVVIGRNEGERLHLCLLSVIAPERPVIYVDSGSTDSSVHLARSLGAHVVDLDMSRPFTAARGRNAGLARLLELAPHTTFVQFVDGDCQIHPDWLDTAAQALASEPQLAAVCGRLRERNADRSLYNKLCDLEWDAPTGLVRSCGGNAMYRVAPLLAVGRFNDDILAGEEPELCYRLRRAGHTIRRLPAEMALHDADMHRFAQWWKRAARGGYALAHGAALHGRGPERYNVKRLLSVLFWTLCIPLAALAWPVLAATVFRPLTTTPIWILAILAASLGLLAYLYLIARVARAHLCRGRPLRLALTVALFTLLAKFAELTGILRVWLDSATHRPAVITDFEHATPTPVPQPPAAP